MGNKGGKNKKKGGDPAPTKPASGSTTNTTPAKTQRYKILLIGDRFVVCTLSKQVSAAGKSSVLLRYVDNTFSDAFISNIGSEYKEKTITVDGLSAKLQIVC